MKKKINIFFSILFLLFVAGASTAIYHINNTTRELSRLVELHRIEDLRQSLVIGTKSAQAHLFAIRTPQSPRIDDIVRNVMHVEKNGRACLGCHHEPDIARRLEGMNGLIEEYKQALSYYITAMGSAERLDALKNEASSAGNALLTVIEVMSSEAQQHLDLLTSAAMARVRKAKTVLFLSIVLSLVFGAAIAVNLRESLTRPLQELVKAARSIAEGNLSYIIPYQEKDEFGEVAAHFNSMSAGLKEGYESLQREVAERKRTQKALQHSENFLRTTFESVRDPFCIIDSSYKIVKMNKGYADLKDMDEEALAGATCYRVLAGREGVCEDCVVEKTFRSGDPHVKEKKTLKGDGMELWTEIYTYPIVDKGGTVSHVIEYSRDVTERKRAEEKLQRSEERYALAARGANDGLWDWDLRGKKIYLSPRWKEMLGYGEGDIGDSPEEWLGRVHEEDRTQLEAKISSHLEGVDSHFESEHRVRHRDETHRWVLARGLVVRDREGRAARMVGSLADITERKVAEQKMLHDALHDGLTGLPNRTLFSDRLEHVIVNAPREPDVLFAVLFIDLDRFKIINDSLGHAMGDKVLMAVGRKVHACTRKGDTVARFGGDEFAILVEQMESTRDAMMVATRVQDSLSKPFTVEGHEVFLTTSIGIAFSSIGYEKPEDMLRDADIAMYRAKAHGKSGYAVFDTKMYSSVLQNMQLETELRHAIEKEEFVLHYQPIVELEGERIAGFESLVRWNHPERGLTYPMQFIPVAEEAGLILDVGEWILRESCRQMAEWQKKYPVNPPLRISVNISSRQFSQPDFTARVREVLRESGLAPECLCLEITESVIMESTESAASSMAELQGMGVQVHIDDFGTGYSSLAYLQRFSISALKIDRTFVSEMSVKAENMEIVKAIISLAQNLNLSVIAEGLEMADQLELFRQMRCHYGQGHLFSKPLGPEAIEQWIKREREFTHFD